jgi:D-3-phosphoglycerate dehydrogenase
MWLAMARKLFQYDRATHAGVWHWQSGRPVNRIAGRTMGIVSFGRIGRAIAARAKAFGVEILVYDPYLADGVAAAEGVRAVGKDEILARADYLMMQVPMTGETRHFLGPAELQAMKPGAFIVNTGRGPTIDNRALYEALASGRLGGAALDDPEEEPAKRKAWNPADNPLFSLSNVIVTPHAAYYSEQSIHLARETAASEVARVLTGQAPQNPVNADRLAARRTASKG